MTKCVACVHANAAAEHEKHPNEQTAAILEIAQRRHENFRKRRVDTLRLCRYHHPNGTARPRCAEAIEFVRRWENAKLQRKAS